VGELPGSEWRGLARESKLRLRFDGAELYLQVEPTGAKSRIFRSMRNGKADTMGLRPPHVMNMTEARGQVATRAFRALFERLSHAQGALAVAGHGLAASHSCSPPVEMVAGGRAVSRIVLADRACFSSVTPRRWHAARVRTRPMTN